MPKMRPKEILERLDYMAVTDVCGFPILGNANMLLGAVRLTAFSNVADWAMFVEILEQDYSCDGMDGLLDAIYSFGSVHGGNPGLTPKGLLHIAEKGSFWPEFEFREHEGSPIFALREGVRAVRVRGQEISVPKSLEEYGEVGVRLDFPPDVQVQEFLQWLSASHGPAVFEPDEALLGCLTKPLPLVLRLREWYHPVMPDRELPSQTETFQQIAEVLATGDPTKYKPKKPPNTDWRNWVI
jgi:hypothetical protein